MMDTGTFKENEQRRETRKERMEKAHRQFPTRYSPRRKTPLVIFPLRDLEKGVSDVSRANFYSFAD